MPPPKASACDYLNSLDTMADVRRAIVSVLRDGLVPVKQAGKTFPAPLLSEAQTKLALYGLQLAVSTFKTPGRKSTKGKPHAAR